MRVLLSGYTYTCSEGRHCTSRYRDDQMFRTQQALADACNRDSRCVAYDYMKKKDSSNYGHLCDSTGYAPLSIYRICNKST